MKKLIPIYLICLFVLIPSHNVKANAFTLSSETLSVIGNGFEQLTYATYPWFGYLPYLANSEYVKDPLENISGKDISTTMTMNDVTNIYTWENLPYDLYLAFQTTAFTKAVV